MIGTIDAMFLSATLFVASHLILSSSDIRPKCIEKIGERGFQGIYSLLSAVLLIYMIYAYGAAPKIEMWGHQPWATFIPAYVMPFATMLVVTAVLTKNPTAVGGEAMLEDPRPATGIVTITRHPLMWGIGLWALSHLVANGDLASILLFGGVAVLAFAGMVSIDRKKQKQFGSAWGPFAMTTSLIPFAAALQGRTKIDWRGITWWKPALGLAIWMALYMAHPIIAGVPAHPGM